MARSWLDWQRQQADRQRRAAQSAPPQPVGTPPSGGPGSWPGVNRRNPRDARESADRIRRDGPRGDTPFRVTPGEGRGGGPQLPPAAPLPPVAPTRDFLADAALLFPWLARMPELLTIFADKWAETGDSALAWAAVRAAPAYDRYFRGNRRGDGTFRYSELEYMAVLDGYAQMFREYGLNPDLFREHFFRGIEGDVSVNEAAQRLASRAEYIQQAAPAAREWYAQNFGWRPSDSDLLASSLDPNVTEPLFRQRAQQSLIGGTASEFGFDRGAERVGRLMQAGLAPDQARDVYSQAAQQVPSLSAFAARFYDPDDEFDIDDFEKAVVLLDPEQQQRARRLIGAERASFSARGAFASDRDGGLTGLAQR